MHIIMRGHVFKLWSRISYTCKTASLYWNDVNPSCFAIEIVSSWTLSWSPNDRQFACCYGCARGLSVASEKWWKFPPVTWVPSPLQMKQSQPICRPTNYKRVMPANWRTCFIPHSLWRHQIKWKHFLCYWPFVQGIHRSPVNSPHKCQWCFLWSVPEQMVE